MFKFDRFYGALGPRRLPNMSNDNGDDSAGDTKYFNKNGKGPNPDDRCSTAGGGAGGSSTGGSSVTDSGGGSSVADSGGSGQPPRCRRLRKIMRGLPCWGTFWDNLYLQNLIIRSKAGFQRPYLNRRNRLLRPNNLCRCSRCLHRPRMPKEFYSPSHTKT